MELDTLINLKYGYVLALPLNLFSTRLASDSILYLKLMKLYQTFKYKN